MAKIVVASDDKRGILYQIAARVRTLSMLLARPAVETLKSLKSASPARLRSDGREH